MRHQTKVTGMILAGGLARRMNYSDKGLIAFKGRPLIAYAIGALSGVVDEIIINSNRSQKQYRQFGYRIIPDQSGTFDGPLAGMLSVMDQIDTDMLVVVPCDSPLIETVHLQKLLSVLVDSEAGLAVAFDGKRIHPVILAIKLSPSLTEHLYNFLAGGRRKIEEWLHEVGFVRADFSNSPEVFANINTLTELSILENRGKG